MSPNNRISKPRRAAEGEWRRVDLHLHTPASGDWQEPGTTYLQWLQKAESRGLHAVAITDHNTVEGVTRLRAEVERLAWLEANDRLRPQERRDLDEYRRIGDKLLVLPGFEFTATFGFHVLGIFPPETPIRNLELLLLRLNVPVDKLTEGSTEVGVTSDVQAAYRLIHEAGGLVIAAHANSAHGVAMRGINFGGQTKMVYTQDPNLHALEVTDLDSPSRRSTARFFDGTKPEYPRRMHCLQGSDAHRLTADPKDKNRTGIGDRVTEICLPEVSFEALKVVLDGDDFGRIRPFRIIPEEPFDPLGDARELGNTVTQSFHETMTKEGGRLNRVLADVVALANTQGGTVFIGASASRKGAPRGINSPNDAIGMLRREIERRIAPAVEVRFEVVQSQGVPVLCLNVPNGGEKPYAFERTRIFIRQEGESLDAVRDEIVQLVLAGRGRSAAPVQPSAAASQPRESMSQPREPMSQPRDAEARPPSEARVPGDSKPGAAPAAPQAQATNGATDGQPVQGQPGPEQRDRDGRGAPPVPGEGARAPSRGRSRRRSTRPELPVVPVVVGSTAPAPSEPSFDWRTDAERMLDLPATAPEAAPQAEQAAPASDEAMSHMGATDEAMTALDSAAVAQAEYRPEEGVTTPVLTGEPSSQAPAEPQAVLETALAHELVPAPEVMAPDVAASAREEVPGGLAAEADDEPVESEPAEPYVDPEGAPSVGVEILSMEQRKRGRYFSIRDLRTGLVVTNVTPGSARRLWAYAINQQLTNPVSPQAVVWSGSYGLWQVSRRTRGIRYDLVLRRPDGSLRVFYGVTPEGMHGPWQEFADR